MVRTIVKGCIALLHFVLFSLAFLGAAFFTACAAWDAEFPKFLACSVFILMIMWAVVNAAEDGWRKAFNTVAAGAVYVSISAVARLLFLAGLPLNWLMILLGAAGMALGIVCLVQTRMLGLYESADVDGSAELNETGS